MQAKDSLSNFGDLDVAVDDLGPLAWVLDELRKSLDGAAKALKRFVRDAEAAKGTDLAALDASQLRIARQQLHQAVGALEMVGLSGPALVLRGMEAAVQKFVQQPEQCSQEAAGKIEGCSFALTEYLEAVLAGKPISAVSLFPQYRDVKELVRADRIHPADLWPHAWRWLEPADVVPAEPKNYDADSREAFDRSVLQILKGDPLQAASQLSSLSLGFAARQNEPQPKIFWKLAAAFFEAVASGALSTDIYVRRAASRVLLQYATLSKGDAGVSDRLAYDLLFFCAQAKVAPLGETPLLTAVLSAYRLSGHKPVDYLVVQYGRFDPALLSQARKRISIAKESWSSLSAGDVSKLKAVTDQFSLVSDSLVKLHPSSQPLALALTGAVEATVRSTRPPAIELAMEVATAVLCLEAAFEDLDPHDAQLAGRTQYLAERLNSVKSGAPAQPLEPWMEELYRRVSDKQTMGSVVGELRLSLGELEKSLDIFFRNPQDKSVLARVPGQLAQMRGVLSVLGLDQASQAVLRMRDSVEQLLETEVDEVRARSAGTFDQLGNNLGALSFLIDMLNYQPTLAKKLFVYDDAKGELRPLMGRVAKTQAGQAPLQVAQAQVQGGVDPLAARVAALVLGAPTAPKEDLTSQLGALSTHAALAGQADLANSAQQALHAVSAQDSAASAQALNTLAASVAPVVPAPPAPDSMLELADFDEDDLQGIFLDEAREVCSNGAQAIVALKADPSDIGQLTILRRVFHTLKGSARMVGLNEFGEAGWALEQLFNAWLAEQKPASDELLQLASDSLTSFSRWTKDIQASQDTAWSAVPFRISAEAMRSGQRYVALALPSAQPSQATEQATESFDFADIDFDSLNALSGVPEVTSAAPLAPLAPLSSLATADELMEIDELQRQLDSFGSELSDPAAQSMAASDEADLVDLSAADFDAQFFAPVGAVLPATADHPVEAFADTPTQAEEQLKTIGDLRISIPLYNVYLNEADEWSRQLASELSEWAMDRQQPVADSTVSFAHSLAGSSATVGFMSLSTVARALEHALLQSQAHPLAAAAAHNADLFVASADDIRRLLHQFAAGFLKDADPVLLSKLNAVDLTASESDVVSDRQPLTDIDSEQTTEFSGLPVADESVDLDLDLFDAKSLPLATPAVSFVAPVAAAPTLALQASSPADELDSVDAIDAELFPIFEEEALELLPQLGGALRQWSARPDNASARMEVLRTLHTLKGSARLAGALRLGEMAHRIESEIEFLGTDAAATQDFEPLLTRYDAMQHALDVLRLGDKAVTSNEQLTEPAIKPTMESAIEPTIEPVLQPSNTAAAKAQAQAAVTAKDQSSPPHGTADLASLALPALQIPQPLTAATTKASGEQLTVWKTVVPAPQSMVMQPLRQAATASIRVRSQLLDRMVNHAGEVMITRSRLEVELGQLRGSLGDMTDNLNRLRQQLRDIELQAETQMQSRLAQAKELQAGFDPLEFDRFTRVQELTRMMAESVNDVATVQRTLQRTVEATEDDLITQARQTRELQRDLLKTRMVEFEGISDRLYRVVRQASKETGKQVKLDLLGGTIEMDRGMLDRMTPAFEHLLRNCVAHGIESPADRGAAGKDAAGLITVHLRQEGNDVSVEFSDDGAGLDLKRIRDKALASGLVAPNQVINDQQAADLIYMPGFTTAAQVSELAGRGIGMDVVRTEVNSVGGRIETSSVAGKGTRFKLILPLTTAVTQVVMIRSGNLSVGVPANNVETVRRTAAKELQQAYNAGTIDVAGEAVPFFWSGALLQSSSHAAEVQGKTSPVVIFRSAAQRVALHVDEVLGNQEVVVKNLGPQLARLPGLAGMSVLASGAVVLIYNPVALATVYGAQAKAMSADRAEPHMLEASVNNVAVRPGMQAVVPQIPLVMVVDDSITVRRVTQRLLQREGYRVVLAADGLQALERLQEERPAVVLSDIEMPRMDGFDLARNIRADARLKDLPIVMITSRIAEKHREYAKELGVDHYLGKPYPEEELMSLVRRYCQALLPA